MYSYDSLRVSHGKRVSQTVDSPITIMDHFELGDAFVALLIILVFGVVFYSWEMMGLLLFIQLGIVPVVRKRHPKGIFLHWPYRKFWMRLPGLVNPRGRRRYSD